MENKEKCPYCGQSVVLVDSSVIYGKGYEFGLMKACRDFPKCDSYCGLGATVADAELRELRKRCHRLFDMTWKTGKMSRRSCYHWLRKQMGMTAREAHIAQFRKEECLRLLELIDPNRNLIRKNG